MYCIQCGTQLPDQARFCISCGVPQGGNPPPREQSVEEDRWEIAEIKYTVAHKGLFNSEGEFFVDVLGPKGQYTYADGVFFKHPNNKDMTESGQRLGHLVTQLVNKMLSEGWEPIPRGEHWWRYRFQRRVGSLDKRGRETSAMEAGAAEEKERRHECRRLELLNLKLRQLQPSVVRRWYKDNCPEYDPW